MRLCEKHWIVLPPRCRCIIVLAEAGGRSDYLLLSTRATSPALPRSTGGIPLHHLSCKGVFLGGQEIADCSKNDARGPLTVNETLKN